MWFRTAQQSKAVWPAAAVASPSAQASSAQAGGTAAGGAADGPQSAGAARRSGREAKSRTVTVDGHTVLVQNNYTVTGLTYVHGNEERDVVVRPLAPSAPKPTRPAAPRVVPAYEQQRLAHNATVRADLASAVTRRKDFLSQHVATLEHFVTPAVASELRAVAAARAARAAKHGAAAAGSGSMSAKIFQQPALITGGELRDYQVGWRVGGRVGG